MTTSAPAPASAKAATSKSSAKTATKAGGAGTKAKKPAAPRRKKPAAKPSAGASAANTQAVQNAAKTAQINLASKRNLDASKLMDPFWYSPEYVLSSPGFDRDQAMAPDATSEILPEQVQVVEAALRKNGMTRADVTPQAFGCLLEQARRYTLEILADAHDYAFAASTSDSSTAMLSKADLLLADEMRPDHAALHAHAQLPKLNLLAKQVNRKPLPTIPNQCFNGILLPPAPNRLTARTFDVVSGVQVDAKMVQPAPAVPTSAAMTPSSAKSGVSSSGKSSSKPGYGAARGRQIPIQLKSSTGNPTPSSTPPKPEQPSAPGSGGMDMF